MPSHSSRGLTSPDDPEGKAASQELVSDLDDEDPRLGLSEDEQPPDERERVRRGETADQAEHIRSHLKVLLGNKLSRTIPTHEPGTTCMMRRFTEAELYVVQIQNPAEATDDLYAVFGDYIFEAVAKSSSQPTTIEDRLAEGRHSLQLIGQLGLREWDRANVEDAVEIAARIDFLLSSPPAETAE